MSARLANVLETRDNEAFVGRDAEFLALDWLLELPGPRVLHLSGPAGIGKSTLLNAFTARSRDRGATIIRLDCRSVEPSRPGLLTALASATGAADPTAESIISRIRALDGSVILVLDGYELFLLMDTFLRLEFGPQLPGSASVLVAGRNGPVGAWLGDPGWQGRFRAITLGPLTERDALTFLQRQGFDSENAKRINAVARGHPLALTVATRLGQGPSQRRPEDAAMGAVIDLVTQDYLASTNGGPLREALEAASVIRRVTESLIAAMVPDLAPGDTVDRLLGLPFVESTTDGLFIHDAVRDAIATRLAA
ncbi:MAG: AAA family ATPase, partial [Candidatus Rokubacteria bacterium]|nr:AAA family ATPase [Candidatus Rokubacteria bacterium]